LILDGLSPKRVSQSFAKAFSLEEMIDATTQKLKPAVAFKENLEKSFIFSVNK